MNANRSAKKTPFIHKIIRSKRKSVSLTVDNEGKLIVRAPKRVTKREINALVEKHAAWIRKKQAEKQKQREALTPHRFLEGELFFFLGEKYPLQLSDAKESNLELRNGRFQLSNFAQTDAKALFEKWYKKEARALFTNRINFYAEEYGFEYAKLKLSSAKTLWGSCSQKGNINLTWRLVMMPPKITDYVIVHELCHLREHNHSKRFWAQVEAILPDYKDRRNWLRENGSFFHFP